MDTHSDPTGDQPLIVTSGLGLHNMVKVKNAHLRFFNKTPLYYEASKGIGFEVYKPPNVTIQDMRIQREKLPSRLYMHSKDKISGLKELQRGLNIQLQSDLKSSDPDSVQKTLISLVDETIQTPDAQTIEGVVDTVDIVFAQYLANRNIIDKLVHVMVKDYTTALHSVNVMSLTFRFCLFCGMSHDESKKLGLAALLHDVGKVKIPQRLLKADRRLTEVEFDTVKKHPVLGYQILKGCNLPEDINVCALNHHERADGSGYPNKLTHVSDEAAIIGFIDCYEALTCNERPYRNAIPPFMALSQLKTELFRGDFKVSIYEKFVKSLG